MEKIYKHLGYYNNVEDIKRLSMESAAVIVYYMRSNQGHFYFSVLDDPDTNLNLDEEKNGLKDGSVRLTEDGRFAIVDTSWPEWKAQHKNDPDGDSDVYIDIYEIMDADGRTAQEKIWDIDNKLATVNSNIDKIKKQADEKIKKLKKERMRLISEKVYLGGPCVKDGEYIVHVKENRVVNDEVPDGARVKVVNCIGTYTNPNQHTEYVYTVAVMKKTNYSKAWCKVCSAAYSFEPIQ